MCCLAKICKKLFNKCKSKHSTVELSPEPQNPRTYFSNEEQKQLQEKYPEELHFQERDQNIVKLNEVIGIGAFGTVFKGQDKDNYNRNIAIKEIDLNKLNQNNSSKIVKECCKEIKIISKLSHRNIVQYLGCKQIENYLEIYMEYIENGSLLHLIRKKGTFSESEIRKVLIDVLEGLQYLHFKKIVHRDIKGANVLITKNGTCKLADFGCSNLILGDLSYLKSFVGTCNWMAPEVIQEKGYGRFADIWSVGCLILEMATGKPPWCHLTNQFSIFMHVCKTDEVPQLPNGYSAELQDIVNRCLRRDDKERPNVCELLMHPFINRFESDRDYILEPKVCGHLVEQNTEEIIRLKRLSADLNRFLIVNNRKSLGYSNAGSAEEAGESQVVLLRRESEMGDENGITLLRRESEMGSENGIVLLRRESDKGSENGIVLLRRESDNAVILLKHESDRDSDSGEILLECV